MKKLPIGIQDFEKVVTGGYLYVDKTEYLYELQKGSYFFLSRPRRFGKSLLVSTLKYLFQGRKELFKGLWIENKIEWAKHPVIHIDFSRTGHQEVGFSAGLKAQVALNAEAYGIALESDGAAQMFAELIRKLSGQGKVVLLIDEYDKPIIDNLEKERLAVAKENRSLLKSFYGVIKGSDEHLRFCLLTGVSKFSKVSVFSDLNNLTDVTLGYEPYTRMLGYTQGELETCFADRIEALASRHGGRESLLAQVREWYNGYSWSGADRVYNPFSVLSFFAKGSFENFWFETGTPTFLIHLLREKNYELKGLEGYETDMGHFNQFDIENLQPEPVLFQTGYLTVKTLERGRVATLGYPNREVSESFSHYLLDGYTGNFGLVGTVFKIRRALEAGDVPEFHRLVKGIFDAVKYPHIEKKEAYFHSIFYLIVKLLGFEIESEVLNARGRMDAVIKTEKHIYILEFKLASSSAGALKQIKDRGYADAFALDGRPITLIGLAYDTDKKALAEPEVG